eukprot:TRINITY_DN12127_c0_g1_i1.p1 TRINITY_DN12127_c0_g1~~TRINITY_DN12127_c0_g1_i1.p1  ORF type:complete len:152 (-),score=27.43 TRINITY_DN12127_c0_g1_i1:46-501(-)
MTTITIAKEYGYVLASVLATGITTFVLGGKIGGLRKKYNVPLPFLYADEARAKVDTDAYKFNCAQRGHQNLLETHPFIVFLLLAGGLKHPIISAVTGLLYCVGAFSFFNGYATGVPEERYKGLGGLVRLPLIVGLGTTVSTVLTLLDVQLF